MTTAPPTPPAPPAAPPRTPPQARSAWARAGVALLVVVVAALATAAIRLTRPLMGARSAALPAALTASAAGARPHAGPFRPEVEMESRIFQVAEATGRVEAQRNGKWVMVAAGDVLTTDDLVRTGAGRALLKLGGTTEVELRDRVEIRLDSISRAGASLDLRRGRVVAHIGRAGNNVAITAAHTRTANAGDLPARFIVTADEHGRVAVAATEGAATFESAGRTVTVGAGTATRAEPNQAPLVPEKIAEDVLLSVVWPTGERHEEAVPVAGKVTPGSQVRINGAPTGIDGTGHFVASVAIRAGANPVEVEVEDAAGRTKRERRDIRRAPTRTPDLVPVPAELWQK